ncbi:MAG TPA: hypothetical protein PK668_18925 [Myxococcota bacterium]|nr:hypothetical protein [Myxococcota bacterium]HRY95196.1 hypothetical protein [Myxococcota bacterium]HSA20509.1 hypothetical protein [Myxococcota bacterium]
MPEPESKQERMYQAALLRIAMKMRKEELRGFEDIFREILKDMELEETEFRHYLNAHMQSLMATVKARGY